MMLSRLLESHLMTNARRIILMTLSYWCVLAAEEDLEALCVVRDLVDELMAECASLTVWTEQEMAEGTTLAARICQLEATTATRGRELGAVMGAVW